MVDKVHEVRPVGNNNDMPFSSQKFDSLNVWVAAFQLLYFVTAVSKGSSTAAALSLSVTLSLLLTTN